MKLLFCERSLGSANCGERSLFCKLNDTNINQRGSKLPICICYQNKFFNGVYFLWLSAMSVANKFTYRFVISIDV